MNKWSINDIPDQSGRVIIVTGGNSGLGYESVKALAGKGAEVIMASRSIDRGQKAINALGETAGPVTVMQLDLNSFDSINAFADEFKQKYDRLDILMNNAGIMTTPYFQTVDGLEGQMGTNHFGHFLLTAKLFELIKNTPEARIVNISSKAHNAGKMDFDNLIFADGKDYSPMKSYGRSKLANLLFTYEMQRRVTAAGLELQVLAAHPGVSITNLASHFETKWWFKIIMPISKLMFQDAAAGALPQLRAATDSSAQGNEYYGPESRNEMKGAPVKVSSNRRSHNLDDAKKLWEASEELTATKFSIV